MKNFTNLFKHKTNPLWIRLLIMTFMLLAGAGNVWGANNVSGGYIYFDNSTTKWTDSSIQFVIGHSSYSRTYVMKKLSNSNVYYYNLDDADYHTWGDATYYAVIGTSSKWGDGNWGSSNLTNATHRTAAYTNTYNLNSGSTYCFTPSSSSNGASLTITTSYPNTTNRAYVYAVSNGSTTATSKATAGTVKVAGYYISSQGTTSSRTVTSTASSSSASNTFVRGTTITMSVNSTGSGYTFKGWYSSSTASSTNLLGSNTTYSYTSSGSSTKTVYAVFEANPTVVISETGGTGIVKLGSATLSTSATSMASGSYELSIEAPANYNVSSVTVSGGTLTAGTTGSSSYSGTVNVSANTTINITYEKACDEVAAPALSIYKKIVDKCGSVTQGYIKIDNYASYSNCTFYLGNEDQPIKPTDDGLIGISIANTYTVIVKNSCGNKNNSSIPIGTDVITPPNKYTVSASIPQIAFANNDGSINIELAGSDNGVTYNLYKGDAKIEGTTKTGDGNALQWTGITSPGVYTVKANNPCNDGVEAMTGSFKQECITGLKLAFENDKDTYCANAETNIVITYNGTSFDQYTNPGKYGYKWAISSGSLSYTSVIPKIGAKLPVNIKNAGTIQLQMKSCGSTIESNVLSFNVYTAPAEPKFSFSSVNVGQNKTTTLILDSYNPALTYEYYKATTKLGNITSKETTINVGNETGTFTYKVIATDKTCDGLTSESTATLTVSEAGAIIAALGDLKIDAQDPVDFVAMYVKNDGKSDFGATSVTGYTWQFSSDGVNNWSDCASTNVVDGVNYELGMENGSANCNNFRPNKAGTYRCVVKYNTGDTQNSNYLTVTADGNTAKTFKGVTMTLPVVSVNTGASSFPVNNFGGTPSKNADKMKEKISVDVKIFENINGTTQVVYDRKARMNYRGSSSLNFLKKSYAFCPGDEICGDKKGIDYVKTKKLNMLGIGSAKDKDWVLYAAAADPSLMRNRLMFDTFADMTGGWSVSSRYVELVVNGEYKGVYVMMDKITANKDRVNVEWKLDANGNTTQEAFIVKFDKTDKADRYEITSGDQKTFKSKYSGHDGFDTYDTNIDQRFEVEYPEKEDIEDGKGKWSEVFNAIENKINKFEEELAKGNFSEVQKLIDYTSWADWFIITEFAKNIDGYRASNIFVYDGSKPNAKIEARPLWDQELSFNNQCPSYYADYGSNSTSGLLIDKSNSAVYNNDASAPFWFTGKYKGDRGKYNGSGQTFKGLLDDPCFQAEVQARWAVHTGAGGALTSAKMTEMMKGYLADLDKEHELSSSTIHSGTPLDREFNTFWKNKSRATIDCGTGSGCYSGSTGYTDPTFHISKVSLNNWLTGNRRTNLGNIINGWKGTELNITLTITPETGITTPWEAVMVQVNNPSGYDYDLEYTTNTLDKVSGVIINENNDKYTYRIPRPEAWKPGDEEKDGERTDIQYGIKATLKVGEGMAQCGNSSQAPSATTTITLQDEANENCPKP